MPSRGRRGYPIAVLIGLDDEGAHLWLVYSEVVKRDGTIKRTGTRDYNFHEDVVDSLRQLLPVGFVALIVASKDKTRIATFIEHIRKRHSWLTSRVSLLELSRDASTPAEVTRIIKENRLQESTAKASEEGASLRSEELERALDSGAVLYTIEELDEALRFRRRIRAVLVTESFNETHRSGRLYQSVTQRARNAGAQFLILNDSSTLGERVVQLGGMVAVPA